MQRPPLEVADIVRAVGNKFVENSRQWITRKHLKVLRAIVHCRTAELGYHLDECTNTDCGYSGYSYNSCRDRHCPKCQANARRRWINGRKKELLPVPYAHVVLTVVPANKSICRKNDLSDRQFQVVESPGFAGC
jgi:predicted Zn-ribbon and HTH transcriptional regulator